MTSSTRKEPSIAVLFAVGLLTFIPTLVYFLLFGLLLLIYINAQVGLGLTMQDPVLIGGLFGVAVAAIPVAILVTGAGVRFIARQKPAVAIIVVIVLALLALGATPVPCVFVVGALKRDRLLFSPPELTS